MVLIWYATQVTSENKNSTTVEGGEIQSAEALKKLEQQIDQLLKSA